LRFFQPPSRMFNWLLQLSIADQIYLSLLLTVLIILLFRYRVLEYNLRPLVWLTAVHLLAELAADSLHYVYRQNNIIVYHILAPVEYVIIAVIFYRTFGEAWLRRVVLWSIPAYILVVVLLELFWEPPNQNNSLAYLIESLLIVYGCFSYFRSLLKREGGYRPEKDRTFWFLIALLFYFIGNFFILGTMNYFVQNDRELGGRLYYAGYAFYYLLYTITGVICLLHFPVTAYDHDDK
jgi:uncharacterized PurR-regulated membrane protein YhhQ (DUF165 family)